MRQAPSKAGGFRQMPERYQAGALAGPNTGRRSLATGTHIRPDLDIEDALALAAYLRETGRLGPLENPAITRLSGGVSSRTMRVERADGEAWVVKQSLDRFRVASAWHGDPRRIRAEAMALRWLTRLTPAGTAPGFLFEDFTNHILAMHAVPQPHVNWKASLLDGGLAERHVTAFGQLLGTIHREAAPHLSSLARDFAAFDFFEALRIEPYYRQAASQAPAARAFLEALIADTLATRLTLVHGDFSPKNVLIHHDRLVLLDHEAAHIGDPAFDVGFALTHFLSKAHHLREQRAAFAQAATTFWGAYWETLAQPAWRGFLESRAVRHALGCLLARVAGRSPLEYLTTAERQRQQAAVLALMARPPASIAELAEGFVAAIA